MRPSGTYKSEMLFLAALVMPSAPAAEDVPPATGSPSQQELVKDGFEQAFYYDPGEPNNIGLRYPKSCEDILGGDWAWSVELATKFGDAVRAFTRELYGQREPVPRIVELVNGPELGPHVNPDFLLREKFREHGVYDALRKFCKDTRPLEDERRERLQTLYNRRTEMLRDAFRKAGVFDLIFKKCRRSDECLRDDKCRNMLREPDDLAKLFFYEPGAPDNLRVELGEFRGIVSVLSCLHDDSAEFKERYSKGCRDYNAELERDKDEVANRIK